MSPIWRERDDPAATPVIPPEIAAEAGRRRTKPEPFLDEEAEAVRPDQNRGDSSPQETAEGALPRILSHGTPSDTTGGNGRSPLPRGKLVPDSARVSPGAAQGNPTPAPETEKAAADETSASDPRVHIQDGDYDEWLPVEAVPGMEDWLTLAHERGFELVPRSVGSQDTCVTDATAARDFLQEEGILDQLKAKGAEVGIVNVTADSSGDSFINVTCPGLGLPDNPAIGRAPWSSSLDHVDLAARIGETIHLFECSSAPPGEGVPSVRLKDGTHLTYQTIENEAALQEHYAQDRAMPGEAHFRNGLRRLDGVASDQAGDHGAEPVSPEGQAERQSQLARFLETIGDSFSTPKTETAAAQQEEAQAEVQGEGTPTTDDASDETGVESPSEAPTPDASQSVPDDVVPLLTEAILAFALSYFYENGQAYVRLPQSQELVPVIPEKGAEELYRLCVEQNLPLTAAGLEGTGVNCETLAATAYETVAPMLEKDPTFKGAKWGYIRHLDESAEESDIPIIAPDLGNRVVGHVTAEASTDHVDLAAQLPDGSFVIVKTRYDMKQAGWVVDLASVDNSETGAKRTHLTWEEVKAHYAKHHGNGGETTFVDNLDRLSQAKPALDQE